MKTGLTGKVVVVTGAAQGIGFATATTFGAEGAKVVLNDVNGTELARARHKIDGAIGCCADVSTPDGAETVVDVALKNFGQIDVLVNNAGISRRAPRIEEVSFQDWRTVLAVNLDSAFLVSKAAMPALRKARGCIVNVSSLTARRGSIIGNNLAYTAAKAGLIGLTIALATDGAKDGVRANAVAPGPTDTPHMADVSREHRDMIIDLTPLKRLGHPQDIADLIVFLASDRASFISGEVVNINGGIYFN